jgi:hypothetical protein
VSAHSAGAYTATLLVMVNAMKGGGRTPPTLTSQANFTLMTECTLWVYSSRECLLSIMESKVLPLFGDHVKVFWGLIQ